MPREIDRKYGSGVTRISQDPSNRTATKPLKKRKKMPANDPTKFNQGGMCRGAGAAIKGTDFKGVF